MIRKYAFLIPIVGLLISVGIWAICKHYQEPISKRKSDILLYVKQNDGIDAVILGDTRFATGGTAWSVQPKGNPFVSFTVVDDGYFHTDIVSDDYKELFTRP